MEQALQEQKKAKTSIALYAMHILNEPFVVLFAMLLYILRKDLGATTFQLSFFAALRPTLSLLSFYWGSNLTRKRGSLVSNMALAWVLGRVPFLLIPFFNNVWYIIFAAGMFQLFQRAGTPAMIELLKQNIPKQERETLFSRCFSLSFFESILLGIGFSMYFAGNKTMFFPLFITATLISLLALPFQATIPNSGQTSPELHTIRHRIFTPWKEMISLLKRRPDFAHFQGSFMLGGFGLMLIAPVQAIYFADTLSLEHSVVAVSRSIFMGIGVIGSSLLWKTTLSDRSIRFCTSSMLVGFALFPLVLLLAQIDTVYIYIAFLLYGVAQAGSHLLWNLSGTYFSGDDDSSQYTNANVLTVGIRGLFGPALGGFLCHILGPQPVLFIGSCCCLLALWFTLQKKPIQIRA